VKLRYKFFLTTALLLILPSVFLTAQIAIDRPRVGVLPVQNASGSIQYDGAATTIRSTIDLVLRLIGTYDVVDIPPSDVPAGYQLEQIEKLCTDLGIDNLIFGEIRSPDTGGILFDMSLYDRGIGEVTLQQQKIAVSVLDVFDTTDLLVQEFVGAFSGIRIGFGSIEFQPTLPDKDYIVYLDGKPIGENLRSIPQVLIGERRLVVTQKSAGGESEVLSEQFSLDERQTLRFVVTLSDVTEADRRYVLDLRDTIDRQLIQPGDVNEAERAIRELDAFFSAHATAFPLQQSYHRYDDRRLQLARDYQAIEAGDFVFGSSNTLTRFSLNQYAESADALLSVDTDAGDAVAPLHVEARRNLALAVEMIRLTIAQALSDGDYARAKALEDDYFAFLRNNHEPYNYSGELSRLTAAIQKFERQDRRRRPFWHWLAGGIGLAGIGTGGYLIYDDPITPILDEANALLPLYESSTDVDEVISLRNEIETRYTQANILEIVKWSGIGAGTTLLLSAITARVLSVGRPERKMERFVGGEWALLTAAADQALNRTWGPGESGLLILNRDRMTTVNGAMHGSPWFIEGEPGDTIDLYGGYDFADPHSSGPRVNAYASVRLEPGLNVVIMR